MDLTRVEFLNSSEEINKRPDEWVYAVLICLFVVAVSAPPVWQPVMGVGLLQSGCAAVVDGGVRCSCTLYLLTMCPSKVLDLGHGHSKEKQPQASASVSMSQPLRRKPAPSDFFLCKSTPDD
jgi:hypothetical protein